MGKFYSRYAQKGVIALFCALIITLFTQASFCGAEEAYKIRDLYAKGDVSPLAQSHVGQKISVFGFMAPPLLPELDFFILTKMPMSSCPFCEPEMEWPDYLVFVRMEKAVVPVNYRLPIVVTGELEIGDKVDEETGFYSKVRLINAKFELVNN